MKQAVDGWLSQPRGSAPASLAFEGLEIPKAHSFHSAVANLIFFFHDEQPSSLCFQLTLIFFSVSLVTFGVIFLSIYPSGIFRKDKFAESFVAHGCKRDEPSPGSLDPERESSEVRHGFPPQGREPPPWGSWSPPRGTEPPRNSIRCRSSPWILFVPMEQMESGKSCRGSERNCETHQSEQRLWLDRRLYHL